MPTLSHQPPKPTRDFTRWVESSGLSRPRLAGAILAATVVITGLSLAAWQILLIDPTHKAIEAWLFEAGGSSAEGGLAGAWPGKLPRDAAALAASTSGKVVSVTPEEFVTRLETRLSQVRGNTFVLYVAGPGVAGASGDGEFILPAVPGIVSEKLRVAFSGGASVSVDHLVSRCRRYPDIQKLIIWDAGQVDSDRDLGVYANPFLHRLRLALPGEPSRGGEAPANLAVLVSCSPGQTSWWSDLDGRSVFGHFVERALTGQIDGGRVLTVQALARYVRGEVQGWVRQHRGAVQTPLLLSDLPEGEIDFVLRTPRGKDIVRADARSISSESPTLPGAVPASPKQTAAGPKTTAENERDPSGSLPEPAEGEARRTMSALKDGWKRFGAWDQAGGLHRDPRAWLSYQQKLARAERLLIAREYGLAMGMLAGLDFVLPAAQEPLSIAELDARGTAPAEVEAARRSDAKALAELTGSDVEANRGASPTPPGDAGRMNKSSPEPRAPRADPAKDASASMGASTERGAARPGDSASTSGSRGTENSGPGGIVTGPDSVKVQAEAAVELKSEGPAYRTFEGLIKDSPVGWSRQADPLVPRYLEAQLLLWGWTYTHSRLDPNSADVMGPDPEAFHGARGPLLRRAVQSRRMVEAVAAYDPRVLLWTAPILEAGDRHRREAQDRLFSADPGGELQIGVELDEAAKEYSAGAAVAGVINEALDVLDRSVASAPGLAHWLYRRSEPGNPEDLSTLLSRARELVHLLVKGPGDRPAEVEKMRLDEVRLATSRLTVALESLRKSFMAQLVTATRWRDLDALLEVPFVPALVHDAAGTLRPEEKRLELLERLMSAKVAGSLADPVGGPESADAPPFDNRTQALAAGLARLELELIAIHPRLPGEQESRDQRLDECRGTLASAARSDGDDGERFQRYARLSAEIRGLRRSRLDALQSPPSAERLDLFARDLAVRTLAPADAKYDEGADPPSFLRQSWLTWQANRLLEDFQPTHTRAVLALARKTHVSPQVGRDLDRVQVRADRLDAASPEFADLPDQLKLSRQDRSRPLPLKLRRTADLPEGLASLFIAFDPSSPIALQVAGSETSLRTGALLQLSGRDAVDLQAEVSRSRSNPEVSTLKLRPGLFFRGHLFPRQAVSLALEVASRPGIGVQLAQSNEALVREWKDQFPRHPNKGFLHPGTSLGCKMIISHTFDKETLVEVRHGFDATMLKTARVKLMPGLTNSEVLFDVQTEVDGLSDINPKFYTVEVEPVAQAQPIRGAEGGASPKFSDRFPFRMLRPDEIVAIEGMTCDGSLTEVYVRHLASDPVCGPVKVKVAIAGHVPGEEKLRRGWFQRWWVTLPGLAPEKIEVAISIANRESAIKTTIASGNLRPPPPASPGEEEKPPKL